MARTPSMTMAEAETLLGPRGHLRIDANNRGTLRKWLTAQGFPSLFVGGLSMTELALAYNQTDGAGLDKIRRKLAEIPPEDREEPAEPQAIPSHDRIKAAHAAFDRTMSGEPDIVAAIQAIASQVVPKASGIDAESVKAIIRDELPSLIPTTRIEIVTNGEVRDLGEQPMHHKFPTLVKALSCGLHVCLVGPAGSGKTTAAEMAAKALGRQFRIQGGVSGEHSLNGYCDARGHYLVTPYRDAFENGHVFIKDEIDVDDPAALLTLNAGLANGYASFPDKPEPVMRAEGFQVVACANTWGQGADRIYVGRNQLDGATLDRFFFIAWDYDEALEAAIIGVAKPRQNSPTRTAPAPAYTTGQWLDRVLSLRRAAFEEKARIVISPRASIMGAKLLAAGMPSNEVEDGAIWKGTDPELRRRIEARAAQ